MADEIFEGDPEDLAEQEQAALLQENTESITPVDPEEDVASESATQSGLSKEAESALMKLVDDYEQQDEETRDILLREWKLMEHFWNDNQHLIWSEIAKDWRPIDSYDDNDDLDLAGFEPKTVNIYKAHGESVIAAMSSGIPAVRFFPDDADSQDDVSTAKVWSHAADLLQRRNKSSLLLIKTLYILWNQGFAAAYNYTRQDPKLGTVMQPVQGMVPQAKKDVYCENCGQDLPDVPNSECPECGYVGPPSVDEYEEQVPGIVGQEPHVRITEDIQVYSPLYFRIPYRATSQDECAYLTLDTEQDPGALIAAYIEAVPDIREKIKPTKDSERYDRWARDLSGQYSEHDLITVRQRWLRNWSLHNIEDEKIREELLQKFPDGVWFVQAGDEFITAKNENLDDHWTITISPTSPHLVTKALGHSLKNIQEMTNELVTMTLDNIEHGTPMSMIDTELLNLSKFRDSRTAPGMAYPVKVPPGQKIQDFIYETRPATLSDEVRHFSAELKEFGQFTSGAFPSIYGGVISGGSGTAKEYEQSRAQALQRLQITWRIVNEFWTALVSKSTKDYLEHLTYDERFVKRHGGNSFINVWIRKSEATGRIGEVIAESSEQFPLSAGQKRDMLLAMLQMDNENINVALFHPENVGLLASNIGFPEFYIPGDDDRSKQLNEVADLLTMQPIPMLGPQGVPIMISTIQPDADFDNHPIHMQTIQAFAVSEVGQQIKKENPGGYANLLAHWKMHEQAMIMTMMKQQAFAPQSSPEGETVPEPQNSEA